MEIRAMRCCMCPNKNDSFVCRPPHGFNDPKKQCNFVLDFQDRFKRTYSVRKCLMVGDTQYYAIFCKSPKKNCWNSLVWTHIYGSRDAAQEELNKAAIQKSWTPVEINPEEEQPEEDAK